MIDERTRINEYTGQVTTSTTRFPEALDDEGYLFMIRNRQCRIFSEVQFPKALSYSDKGRIQNLSKCIEKDTNCLVKRTKCGKTHMTEHDIYKSLDLGERQGITLLRKLTKLGLIAKVSIESKGIKTHKYYINPMYYIAGKRLSPALYRMFAEWLDPILPVWASIQLKQIK